MSLNYDQHCDDDSSPIVSLIAYSGLPYIFVSIVFYSPTPFDVTRIPIPFQSGHMTEHCSILCQGKMFQRQRSGNFWECLATEKNGSTCFLFSFSFCLLSVYTFSRREQDLTPSPSQEFHTAWHRSFYRDVMFNSFLRSAAICTTFAFVSAVPASRYVARCMLFCFHVFLCRRSLEVKYKMHYEDM